MDFRWLYYAVTVSKTGSISMAAKTLFTSQPNISHALKRLEEEVGFSLFFRTSNGVTPTEEGLRFLADVSPIVERFIEVENLYIEGPSQSRKVVVSAIDSDVFSQAFLHAFSSETSGAIINEIAFYETDFEHVLQNVKLGHSMMGLIYFPHIIAKNMIRLLEYEKLHYTSIGTDCAYLVTRKDNPHLPIKPDLSFSWLNSCILVDYDKVYQDNIGFRLTELPWIKECRFDRVFHLNERATKYSALELLPTGVSFSCYLSPTTLDRYNLVQIPCLPIGEVQFGYLTQDEDTQHWFAPILLNHIHTILDGNLFRK